MNLKRHAFAIFFVCAAFCYFSSNWKPLRMTKSTHTLITLIFFAIVILGFVFFVRTCNKNIENAKHDLIRVDLQFHDSISDDYNHIIKPYGARSLKTCAVTKVMSPVASFRSNDKALIIFKLPTKSDKKIVDVIKCDSLTPPNLNGQGLWVFSDGHFVDDNTKGYLLGFSSNPSRITPNVYLTLIGSNNQKIVKNDSTLLYSSKLTDCSLSYLPGKDSISMYLAGNKYLTSSIPVRLNFLKRNNFFYLIIQIEK